MCWSMGGGGVWKVIYKQAPDKKYSDERGWRTENHSQFVRMWEHLRTVRAQIAIKMLTNSK